MRTLPLKIPGYAPDDEPYPRTQHNDPLKFWTPISRRGFQYANLLPRVLYHLIQENSQHLAKATFTSDGSDSLLTCLICWRKNSPSLTSWGKFLANFSHGEKYSGKHCYIDQLNDCKYKKMQEGTNTTNLLKSSRFSVIVVNGPKYQTVQVSRDPHKHFAKTGSPVIFLATSSLWKNLQRWDLCTY